MFAAQPAKESHLTYTAPAALDEVMFEQLEYLIDHRSAVCAADCFDCARLAQVQRELLRPFCDSAR